MTQSLNFSYELSCQRFSYSYFRNFPCLAVCVSLGSLPRSFQHDNKYVVLTPC